jgi:hypothetical protein
MYEITMRIQDVNSADYECPFEAKFVDEDVALAAFNAILDSREFWEELICKRYGLTEEDEPWIQLFLTDDESDYSDEDEYWISYEVL